MSERLTKLVERLTDKELTLLVENRGKAEEKKDEPFSNIWIFTNELIEQLIGRKIKYKKVIVYEEEAAPNGWDYVFK